VAEKPWLAGLFIWTGQDYRGEPTPFGWPAISSQFGMQDTTGLMKDSGYYLKSWWSAEPMVHILPHWNWPGKEGQPIRVAVYSNAEAVELFLNGKSLGRQTMARNGHLEWQVPYEPGTLIGRGYADGKEVASDTVETTGPAAKIKLEPYRQTLAADGVDATMVKVSVLDAQGRVVPTGDADVSFTLDGPAKLIGVGNGDPGSHEPDQFVDDITSQPLMGWRMIDASAGANPSGATEDQWRNPFQWYPPSERPKPPEAFVLRGGFYQTGPIPPGQSLNLFVPSLNAHQRVFVAGQEVTARLQPSGTGYVVSLDGLNLGLGEVKVMIAVPDQGPAALKTLEQLGGGSNVAFLQRVTPAGVWRRSLFSGYAQIAVQATDAAGVVTVHASSPGLAAGEATLRTQSAPQFSDPP